MEEKGLFLTMLNEEGWSLLMILAAVIALLGMGYVFMGRDKTMADRLLAPAEERRIRRRG